MQNIDIKRLIAFLHLPKMVQKSPFKLCFKHILRNVQCFEP